MKRCFKCGQEKDLSAFYKHPAMADGHLGKCKECAKADVTTNRRNRRLQYAEYERLRFARPERKAAVIVHQRTRRSKDPEKYKARTEVHRAIKKGLLVRQPCEACGLANAQAHHDDYSKPLEVRWLCFKHHREIGHGQTVLAC